MVQLHWSDSGPANETNAFGSIVSTDSHEGKPVGVVCMHGGSMWLCSSCANKVLALNDGKVRPATADEYRWLRNGSQGPFPIPPPRLSFMTRLKKWWRT